LKGLFVDGDFEPPSRNLTASESLVVKKMQRLKEESILQIDFIQDIKSNNADALKIVFPNIQSFKKHKAMRFATRKRKGLTAESAANKEVLSQLIQHDDGYNILGHKRCSPAYWENKKKEVLAMIRQ
jgi:hypothetical protein